MTELRDRYLKTLGFEPDVPGEKLRPTLNRAYQQRSFEIEHYWKRATYFWGFEVAIFAAFGLLLSKDAHPFLDPLTVLLTALGLLTALAHSLSTRGSKFWQENWENHIDMLEDNVEGRLYKTVWLQKGNVSYSVSGVNVALTDYFAVFWFFATIYVGWKFLQSPAPAWLACLTSPALYLSLIGILTAIGVVRLFRLKTDFRSTVPKPYGCHGETAWQPPCWCRSNASTKSKTFVRRYAPGEES